MEIRGNHNRVAGRDLFEIHLDGEAAERLADRLLEVLESASSGVTVVLPGNNQFYVCLGRGRCIGRAHSSQQK